MPAALLAIVLLSPLPLRAHNGAVAIAVPVEGIVADGDLSDWPEALRTYEVNHVEVGAEPQDEGDLSAWFRVAVDPSTEAIYLALEVTDDDPIVDSAEGADNWDAADGCEVYLLSDHERGRRPRQWVLWGNHRAYWAGATVENGRVGVGGTEGVRVYEWRLALESGTSVDRLGLDVVVCDRDAAGDASWVSWGPGSGKRSAGISHVGDLLLASASLSAKEIDRLESEAVMRAVHDASLTAITGAEADVLLATSCAVLAFVHLMFFVYDRVGRGNLYFGLLCALIAAALYVDYRQAQSLQKAGGEALVHFEWVLLIAALSVGLRAVHVLHEQGLPSRFRVFVAVALITGALKYVPGFVTEAWLMFNLLIVAIAAEYVAGVVRGARSGRRGTWLLAGGAGALLLFFVARALESLGVISELPDAFLQPAYFVLPFLAVQSMHLARESGRATRDLAVRETENRALEQELQDARTMQLGLMPAEAPSVPGIDLAGACRSAELVGGDLFQYFELDAQLSVAVADVTGHAMEAAIPVVMFSGILDKQMEFPGTLEERFAALNGSLCRSLDERKYVCFTMAEIDTETRALRLASCGSPYPLHYRAADGSITELQVDAYPLGVRPDTTYSVLETQLEPGDRLVLYSDGIPETVNPDQEMFGFDATAATVQAACAEGLSAEEVIERLMGATRLFAGHEPQADDMTCVVVRVEG